MAPATRTEEIEQLKTMVEELKLQLATQNENDRDSELDELRSELTELRGQIAVGNKQGGDAFKLPDPFKFLSEFSGNKKELAAWLEEVDDLYNDFKVKNQSGGYSISSLYLRAIKNKIKGEARTLLCASGNPSTIDGIKKILVEHYGDEQDFTTNLSTLFRLRKADRTHLRFFNEMKETSIRLKANLQSKPLTGLEIIEIITVTKYLDNIQEPLGSIIRNSKPRNLEEAYQAVLLNQNAEMRVKPQYSNQTYMGKHKSFKPHGANSSSQQHVQPNTSQPNPNKHSAYKKPAFQPKPRAEAHNNEVEEVNEPEPPVEVPTENDDLDYSDEELNFQTARGPKNKT
ncbi:hypothetical protein RP20_CCG009647 [Aedes albopictus]|nr:hypothetical protein RP20_CCG016643 [Aedes albopictus]KXJ83035.1 hypothetical protein RP20_CCG009647 [Aedes albopictus]